MTEREIYITLSLRNYFGERRLRKIKSLNYAYFNNKNGAWKFIGHPQHKERCNGRCEQCWDNAIAEFINGGDTDVCL